MEQAGRDEEATYYRSLARLVSDAGGDPSELAQSE